MDNCMEYALHLVDEYADAKAAAAQAAKTMHSGRAGVTVPFDEWVQLKEDEERKLGALRMFLVTTFVHVRVPFSVPIVPTAKKEGGE